MLFLLHWKMQPWHPAWLQAPRWLHWGISASEVRKLPFYGQRRVFLEINGEGFERTQIILQCFGSEQYERGGSVMPRTMRMRRMAHPPSLLALLLHMGCGRGPFSSPHCTVNASVRATIMQTISKCKISSKVILSEGKWMVANWFPASLKGWPQRNNRVITPNHLNVWSMRTIETFWLQWYTLSQNLWFS